MSKVASVGLAKLPFSLPQDETATFAKDLFKEEFKDIDRLLPIFKNGQIENRQLAVPMEWFQVDRSFSEKNDMYIDCAIQYSVEAIEQCLTSEEFISDELPYGEIDAIFFISSTGMSTPSIEAKIMNKLPFSPHTKRIPIWGLGCGGGAAGISRAYEYCRAFPDAKVLVVSVELCSLTFQRGDRSKSNLIGTSIFSDGVACALVIGDKVETDFLKKKYIPSILNVQSTLMADSEDVMGWDIKDDGLFVIFSKDIPTIIENWLKPQVEKFLIENDLTLEGISHFVAHPGGKKVIDAYINALSLTREKVTYTEEILRKYGNMSSATVLYVLEKFMRNVDQVNSFGLMAALGPGFSSELLLVKWEEC